MFIIRLLKIAISVCFPIEHEMKRENILASYQEQQFHQVFESSVSTFYIIENSNRLNLFAFLKTFRELFMRKKKHFEVLQQRRGESCCNKLFILMSVSFFAQVKIRIVQKSLSNSLKWIM